MKITQKLQSGFTELICFNISGFVVKIPGRSIETEEINAITFHKRKLFETEVQKFDLDIMKLHGPQFEIVPLSIEV